MKELLKRYWLVALFKESPANTPYSAFLLGLFLIVYWLTLVFQWTYAPKPIAAPLAMLFFAGLILLGSYGLYVWLVLRLHNKTSRFLQTFTTLIACSWIIHLLAFPLMLTAPFLLKSNLEQMVMLLLAILYLLVTMALSAWQFLATAYIFKAAIEIDWLTSILISFGLLAFNVLAVSYLN
ncbi:hypothetical protein ACFORL_02170 [Legionella dresdenensis]|uniref:Yip1 domain protein n=1 Tax=Legionella dresdenensis TaxID=450200 RepID=A0ABV8CCR0_9GAMM